MNVQLRGHHLLCLLGYRGKGYSEEFCANMTDVYEALRTGPETTVTIVSGPDKLCGACPEQHYHCRNESVDRRDAAVLRRAGIVPGAAMRWSDIRAQIAERVAPEDLAVLCAGCQWLALGFCEEGVDLIRRGQPLPEVVRGRKDGLAPRQQADD